MGQGNVQGASDIQRENLETQQLTTNGKITKLWLLQKIRIRVITPPPITHSHFHI